MLNHFTFNGHSTGELGLLVSGINIYGSPSRVVEKINIPYRSGDLLIDTGAYTNYMLTYTVDIMDNTKATAEAISKWLLGSKGYCELTDTYNPEIYRVASYYNQLDYTLSALYRYGKATITFDCKPQKYLTANQPVTLNPTTSEATSYSLSTPAMPLPITLEGNTTQAGSSGKNKLGLANGTYSSNGITAVVNNGVVTVSGSTGSSNVSIIDIPIATLSSSLGTVTKSLNPTGTYTGLQTSVRNSSGSSVGLWTTDASNATASLSGDGTYLRIQANTDITINCTIKPQIEVGSTATAYEPCLSPLTPQQIHSVKGDNEVRVVGKNIIPITATTQTMNGVTFTVNEDGTVRANGTATTSFSFNFFYRGSGASNGIPLTAGTTYVLSTADMQYFPINLQVMRDGQPITVYCNRPFTAQEGDYVSVVWVWRQSGTVFNNALFSPQFEVGSTPTAFEPYKAQVYPINLGSIELNALGNYKDYFHKSDGKWYLHKATNTLLLNGTEDWRLWSASQTNVERFYVTLTGNQFTDQTHINRFTYSAGNTNTEHFYYSSSSGQQSQNQLLIFIDKSRLTTVDADGFKAWVAQNNLAVVTAIYTPTETEITDATLISQLNAISKAKTYEGSTTIVQEGTDAQFKLSMPVPTEVTSEYKGEPIITVNEVGTIVWNDSLIKVNSAPVTINSQTLQCYYYSENKNNDVEINEFPKYEQGENYIGSTMDMSVVPNYWKL